MDDPVSAERSFGFLVYEVSRLLQRSFARRARSLGLTQVQWRALLHLSRNQGINQASFAEILDVQPITLTRLVDRMERDGWIERRAHPSDRRATQLFLTDKTGPLMHELSARAKATLDEAMHGLPRAEREQAIDMLLTVKSNLIGAQADASRRGDARADNDADVDVEVDTDIEGRRHARARARG